MIESVVRLNSLYDFYGRLLTENQNKSFVYYYRYDLSLSEISDKIGISRQGVSENLKRARNELEHYEEILGLYEKNQKLRKIIIEYEDNLQELDLKKLDPILNKTILLMNQLIEELDN